MAQRDLAAMESIVRQMGTLEKKIEKIVYRLDSSAGSRKAQQAADRLEEAGYALASAHTAEEDWLYPLS